MEFVEPSCFCTTFPQMIEVLPNLCNSVHKYTSYQDGNWKKVNIKIYMLDKEVHLMLVYKHKYLPKEKRHKVLNLPVRDILPLSFNEKFIIFLSVRKTYHLSLYKRLSLYMSLNLFNCNNAIYQRRIVSLQKKDT